MLILSFIIICKVDSLYRAHWLGTESWKETLGFCFVNLHKWILLHLSNIDRVGLVDNRPSTDELQNFVWEKKIHMTRHLKRGVTANLLCCLFHCPKELFKKIFLIWIPKMITTFIFLVNNGLKLHEGKYQKSINLVVYANFSHLLSKTFTFYEKFSISCFCLQIDKIWLFFNVLLNHLL